MVLMKIFNLIVDENRWRQIFINLYRDRAFGSGIDSRIDATLGVRIVERVVLYDAFKNVIRHSLDMKAFEERGRASAA